MSSSDVQTVTLDEVIAHHAQHQHENFHRKRNQREVEAQRNYRKYKLPEISSSPKNDHYDVDGNSEEKSNNYNNKGIQNDTINVAGRTKSPTKDWYTSKYGNEPPFPHFNFRQEIPPQYQQTSPALIASHHRKQLRSSEDDDENKSTTTTASSARKENSSTGRSSKKTVVVASPNFIREFAKDWIEEFGTEDNNNSSSGNNKKRSNNNNVIKKNHKKRLLENPNEFVSPIDSRPYAKIISEQPQWSYQIQQQTRSPRVINQQKSISPSANSYSEHHGIVPLTNNNTIHSSVVSTSSLAPLNNKRSLYNSSSNSHLYDFTATTQRELERVYRNDQVEPLGKQSDTLTTMKLNTVPLSYASSTPRKKHGSSTTSKGGNNKHKNSPNNNNNELEQSKTGEADDNNHHSAGSSSAASSSPANSKVDDDNDSDDGDEDHQPVDMNDLEKRVQESISASKAALDNHQK